MNFDIDPPSPTEVELVGSIFKPWEWLTSPKYYGLDQIPEKGPVLFVSNHTVIGGLDVPLFWLKLYREKNIFLRMLVDHSHFKVPLIRDFLAKFGEVDGTRENCAELMRKNQYILVFPGGAREAFKRKGEAYKLLWKNHVGFARMAIRFGCPIVPLASVGPEECYEIVYDSGDMLSSPSLRTFMNTFKIRKDLLVPIVKGLGPTFLPKPQRFYFRFGKAIPTDHFNFDDKDEHAFALRDRVKHALERGIEFLQKERDQDPKKKFINRIFRP